MGLMVVSSALIPLIFGDKWNGAISMIGVLTLSSTLTFSKVLIPTVLKARGKPEYNLKFSLITAIFAFIFVALTAYASPLAAAVGWGIAQLMNLPSQLSAIKRELAVPIMTQIKQTLPAIISSIGMGAVVWLFQAHISQLSLFGQTSLSIAVGALVYALFIMATDRSLLSDLRRLSVTSRDAKPNLK